MQSHFSWGQRQTTNLMEGWAKPPPPRARGLLTEEEKGLLGLPGHYPGQDFAPHGLLPGLLCLPKSWHQRGEVNEGLCGGCVGTSPAGLSLPNTAHRDPMGLTTGVSTELGKSWILE